MINIVYEDNHVIVAVKPPNMLSQADKTKDADMLTMVKEYIKVKYNKPGNVYVGLVHRLDRPVGGLMVFARTSKAAARLSAQMREHEMGREYLCVTEGLVKDKFTLINYLIQNERMNRVMVCDADERGAQEAILHGHCLARKFGTSLCSLRLETGRKHQIRVQMKEMGAPLWGDHRYGHGIPGQQIALWGYRLTFEHPTTHNIMTFQHLPCGSVWNNYADELTEMAIRFANSAPTILREEDAPAAPAANGPAMAEQAEANAPQSDGGNE
ncbi:MAG: RluA family pseudouridine synthase [Clostridia bacterium]|nr:RluA family pseudouridine synthase [Clostridia bacterium]MBQ3155647.1 RluA family pseudouridine synthase [Clostridia bacterium]